MNEDHDEGVTQLLQENSAVNELLRQKAEQGLTNLHRPIEQFGILLSRPAFIIIFGVLITLWIGVNLDLKFTTHKPWDEPPFFWLQGLIGALGLLVAATVLVSQSRQAQLAEQRAQLQLQFIVLTEQRTAKLIELFEELRRDMPDVQNRVDSQAEVMQQPAKPEAILEALTTLEEAGEMSLPPKRSREVKDSRPPADPRPPMTRCGTPQPAPKHKLGSVFQRKQDGRWAAAVGLPDGRLVTRYVPSGTVTPERATHELLARLITKATSQTTTAQSRATP